MSFNPEIHHRRSIRLRDYDYSQNGAYFVTVCVNKKLELFGNIVDSGMVLNRAGKMTGEIWEKLPEKFDGVFLDEYCVMPNHFHGILVIDANPGNKFKNMGENIRLCNTTTDKWFRPYRKCKAMQGLIHVSTPFKDCRDLFHGLNGFQQTGTFTGLKMTVGNHFIKNYSSAIITNML